MLMAAYSWTEEEGYVPRGNVRGKDLESMLEAARKKCRGGVVCLFRPGETPPSKVDRLVQVLSGPMMRDKLKKRIEEKGYNPFSAPYARKAEYVWKSL